MWIWFKLALPGVATMSDSEEPPLPDELADELDPAEEETPLLPHELWGRGNACCAKGCIGQGVVVEAKRAWQAGTCTQDEWRGEFYKQVRLVVQSSKTPAQQEARELPAQSGETVALRRLRWQFSGLPVCRRAFCMLFGVGHNCLERHIEHATLGYPEPVQDLRKARPIRPSDRSASSVADAFWHWAYLNVAESLAESTALDVEPVSASVAVQFGLPSPSEGETKGTALLLDGQVGPSPVNLALVDKDVPRHLPPLLWEQINLLFDDWFAQHSFSGSMCSHTTVRRVYVQKWKKVLPFRRENTHTVCSQCTEFKLWRKRVAADAPESKGISRAFLLHIREQMRDREVDSRIAHMAGANIRGARPPNTVDGDILNLTIDAMEQAKFKIPRHEAVRSKAAAMYWRPQLHVTGVVMDGVQEVWYLSDVTVPKNASTQITYVADALDHAQEVCARHGRCVPQMLRVVSDNASGETKNQSVFKFLAWTVFRRRFRCAESAQLRAGHTHNRQDQRFAVAATAIHRDGSKGLQDAADFAEVIRSSVKPIQGTMAPHAVELLKASWDWTSWLGELPVNVAGHTTTAAKKAVGESAAHVFRFVLRSALEERLFSEVQTGPLGVETAWPHLQQHPSDVILLTKLHIASLELSQTPMVFCPAVFMEKLDLSLLRPAPSVPLSERQARELSKSAAYFVKPPLSLERTGEYLMSLVACDGSPMAMPPPHHFLHHALPHPEESGVGNLSLIDPPLPDAMLLGEVQDGAAPGPVEAAAAPVDAVGAVPPPEYMSALAQPKAARVTVSSKVKKRPAAAEPAVSALAAGAPEGALDQLAPPRGGVLRRPAASRRRVELPPLAEGEHLGCGKCRQSANGCAQCRGRLGFQLTQPGFWVRTTEVAPELAGQPEEVAEEG